MCPCVGPRTRAAGFKLAAAFSCELGAARDGRCCRSWAASVTMQCPRASLHKRVPQLPLIYMPISKGGTCVCCRHPIWLPDLGVAECTGHTVQESLRKCKVKGVRIVLSRKEVTGHKAVAEQRDVAEGTPGDV